MTERLRYKWVGRIIIALGIWAMASCSDDDCNTNLTPPVGADNYHGEHNVVTLKESMSDFRYADFVCEMTTESGEMIRREGHHVRIGGLSELRFKVGLRPGIYRLVRLLAPEVKAGSTDTTWVEHGLGCRIQIGANADTPIVMEEYDEKIGLYGSGTKSSPYLVSCGDSFKRIRDFTNNYQTNQLLQSTTYFKQTNAIDMYAASFRAGGDEGWLPIGNTPNCPFRGVFDGNNLSITNLYIDRASANKSFGLGLFGFAESAVFENMVIEKADIKGCIGVGSLLGCAVAVGDYRAKVALTKCYVKNSTISAAKGCFGAGGLVGYVDKGADVTITNSSNVNTNVTGDYCTGGLMGGGGMFSRTLVKKCDNSGTISTYHTGAGGIVGSVDSLMAVGCSNTGKVTGATQYTAGDANNGGLGAGGIAGGSGKAVVIGCNNTAAIEGHTGVGGIVGSTRICIDKQEGAVFNDLSVQSCYNEGSITGKTSVGGIVGEAQFGCFAVFNSGEIQATDSKAHVGGIAGSTSISVLYKAVNNGKVTGNGVKCAGGLVGKTVWGNLYACTNMGTVNANAKYTGGVIGLAGNYTVMNYCTNLGEISNTGKDSSTGGVIGELGDPRVWSGDDIALCVFGGAEIALGAASLFISAAGSSLSAAEWPLASKFVHYIHLFEYLLDGITLAYDIGYGLAWGSVEMATEVDLGVSEAELQKEIDNSYKALKDKMKTLFSTVDFKNVLPAELNVTPLNNYLNHINTVCESYEKKKENANTVSYNMNYAREERYEKLEHGRKANAIAHKVVAGVCVIGSIAAIIASAVLTAGTTAAAAAVFAGVVSTTAGGLNAVTEGCLNYTENVVVVGQCVNTGPVTANNAQYAGGVIGNAHQNCYISKCLNAGQFKGSQKPQYGGGLFGHVSSACKVSDCLNVGMHWPENAVGLNHSGHISDVFYYDKDSKGGEIGRLQITGLSLKQLYDSNSYNNWDKSGSVWSFTSKEGYFPIPNQSVMQKQ